MSCMERFQLYLLDSVFSPGAMEMILNYYGNDFQLLILIVDLNRLMLNLKAIYS